ncbi:MAG: protein kinase, partial [Gammaproteobacteria bacterium]
MFTGTAVVTTLVVTGATATLAKTSFETADAIRQQIKLAKANKEQSQLIGKRVDIIVGVVQDLVNKDFNKEPKRYEPSFRKLQQTLEMTLDFVKKFSSKKWFTRVARAGAHASQFEKTYAALDECLRVFNLGLQVQQMMDKEEEQKALMADIADLQDNQEEIMRLNREAFDTALTVIKDDSDRRELVIQQIDSLKEQFIEQFDAKTAGKPAQRKNELELTEDLLVPFHKIEFEQRIAEGREAKVFRGQLLKQPVAVKVINHSSKKEVKEEFIREVQIMRQLGCQHTVQFLGACIENGRYGIVMEYMANGNLSDFLKHYSLTAEHRHQIALDIAIGLHYMHHQGVHHCEIKSENILVDEDGRAKLADFGIAKMRNNQIKPSSKTPNNARYRAPESYRPNYTYMASADVFSYGMLLWEIITGKEPFSKCNEKEVKEKILSGERPDLNMLRKCLPDDYAKLYAEIITNCWQASPASRMELSKVIEQLRSLSTVKQGKVKTSNPDSLYESGVNAERNKDYPKAAVFYKQASELGNTRGRTNYAFCLLTGRG